MFWRFLFAEEEAAFAGLAEGGTANILGSNWTTLVDREPDSCARWLDGESKTSSWREGEVLVASTIGPLVQSQYKWDGALSKTYFMP